ncbi:UxaA family hydrolase [Cytobacillus dafuensis]|uniref:SAF domain-containing protein n=1 Tax=Cytobacillus dafuensis TaxID=1742359 RepID=A0A5B8Z4R9_CYTDA|nr:UxaA family hydrolase [Cytobacillus dafuensis]QED47931.1 hypothetical protein FSZ17_12125 [Cytobacillus dafuensis]
MRKAICLDEKDNVVTAVSTIKSGEQISYSHNQLNNITLTVKDEVPLGFKIAVTDIRENAPVIKYGEVIGKSTEEISKGSIVHTHNLKSIRGSKDAFVEGGC